jgi:hypothetical protein
VVFQTQGVSRDYYKSVAIEDCATFFFICDCFI